MRVYLCACAICAQYIGVVCIRIRAERARAREREERRKSIADVVVVVYAARARGTAAAAGRRGREGERERVEGCAGGSQGFSSRGREAPGYRPRASERAEIAAYIMGVGASYRYSGNLGGFLCGCGKKSLLAMTEFSEVVSFFGIEYKKARRRVFSSPPRPFEISVYKAEREKERFYLIIMGFISGLSVDLYSDQCGVLKLLCSALLLFMINNARSLSMKHRGSAEINRQMGLEVLLILARNSLSDLRMVRKTCCKCNI